VNQFNLPENEKLAAKVIDAQSKETSARIEQGWLGKVWGTRNAARNIAGVIVTVLVFLFAYVVLRSTGSQDLPTKDALVSVSSLITLGLGYLFGRASADKD
jgi:hypothetical protein